MAFIYEVGGGGSSRLSPSRAPRLGGARFNLPDKYTLSCRDWRWRQGFLTRRFGGLRVCVGVCVGGCVWVWVCGQRVCQLADNPSSVVCAAAAGLLGPRIPWNTGLDSCSLCTCVRNAGRA